MYYKTLIFVLFVNIKMAKSAIPGTFFWKPRLGLHLVPPLPVPPNLNPPDYEHIHEGKVVIIEGYSLGVTVLSLAEGYHALQKPLVHLSPFYPQFYTNAYRWTLRHLNLLPFWMGGKGAKYPETHKVWRRRYFYMNDFIPDWMTKFIFWIRKRDWDQEKKEYRLFQRYAETTFGRHYKYPNKKFQNYKSDEESATVNAVSDSSSNQ